MSLKREWARLRQQWKRRNDEETSTDSTPSRSAAAPHWLDQLRWWLLPTVALVVVWWSFAQLYEMTHPPQQQHIPIILDAPLPSATQWPLNAKQQDRYFLLKPERDSAHWVASQPSAGTRAYRGSDAIPVFGPKALTTDVYVSPCRPAPGLGDLRFYTHDGMILWACQSPQEEGRLELRRIGWRFQRSTWRTGLRLGRSANNDIVVSSAMIPNKSIILQLRGEQLYIRTQEEQQGIPKQKRLLCLRKSTSPVLPTPGVIAAPKRAPKAGAGGAKSKSTTQRNDAQASNKASDLLSCTSDPILLAPGQSFRLYTKTYPSHGVLLLWKESMQERATFDLYLHPTRSAGRSVRYLSTTRLAEQEKEGFFVGKATAYFRRVLPDTVRTLDLEDRVHWLVLRRHLQYLGPQQLRQNLGQRYHPIVDLTAPQSPTLGPDQAKRQLKQDRYLRNRVWMVNRSLARDYRSQARALFRIRFGQKPDQNSLLGLGLGSSTLRAPKRNLLAPNYRKRRKRLHPRLATVLTAQAQGRAFLEVLESNGQARHDQLFFLGKAPMQLLGTTILPPEAKKRGFAAASAVSHPGTLLWVNDKAHVSRHPFLRLPSTIRQTLAKRVATLRDNASKQTPSFVYQVRGRWWQRGPGLQRSSTSWPVSAIAARLAQSGQQDALTLALKKMNQGRWERRKHCGRVSRKEGRRWRNKEGCWRANDLFASKRSLLVPCDKKVLRPDLYRRHCRNNKSQPSLDAQGRIILAPVTSAVRMTAASILPVQATTNASNTSNVKHMLYVFPQSLEIRHNGRALSGGQLTPLRDGDLLRFGRRRFRYKAPDGILALSRYRGDKIVSQYPEGPTFAHVIAGSVGGPYRASAQGLKRQLPPQASTAKAKQSSTSSDTPAPRHIVTTLDTDLQRIAFATAQRHFSRLDSEAFKTQFRRRFFLNPHQPHAGAVLLLNRRTGQVLTALSFPSFNPNRPSPLQNEANATQNYRYLRGQLIDRFGILDPLLAYDPTRLPPSSPQTKRLEGKPNTIPNLLEALYWDREEELRGVRGYARSGWLTERALNGAQVPGSTVKVVTALAYARWLQQQGKPIRFPAHHCAGGMMFQLPVRKRDPRTKELRIKRWKTSPIHFRCHKRGGHGTMSLKQALAVSCNVYFAKLALEMAGAPAQKLRHKHIRWYRSRYGGSGRYQFMKLMPDVLTKTLRRKASARELFRTANALGFTMRYTHNVQKRQYSSYTDLFWEPGMSRWPLPPKTLAPKAWRQAFFKGLRKRHTQQHPAGFFGIGRYFGYAAAYPAWQQWIPSAREPRYGKPTSIVETFGSQAASLRGMAYVGFGQNLTASPLRLALVAATVANGGWLPAPRLWKGDKAAEPPHTLLPTPLSRPGPTRILSSPATTQIREAMAAVTQRGTAARPFATLNRSCLKRYGLRVIGKTGTAETRSSKSRTLLLRRVKRSRKAYARRSKRQWLKQSACYRRKFWRYDYPEENVADSLFMGAIVPDGTVNASKLTTSQWRFQDLAFAVVVKNGYHPEGVICQRKGRDLDRSEAKYLAHDILLHTLQHLGACHTP